MGLWSAWHYQTVGGFAYPGVRSVGASGATAVLWASADPGMPQRRSIRSLPAMSRVRIGSSIAHLILSGVAEFWRTARAGIRFVIGAPFEV